MYRESQLDNRIPAYDGRKSLFTAGPLPFTSKVFVVVLTDDNRGSSSDSDRKKREREFKVTIKFASKTDLYNLTQFLRRMQLDCPYETIQALDVALRATPSENYIVAGRSFFSLSLGQPGPLGGGTEYYRGFYQSIRPTQIGLTLNIDVSSRAFYEPILVTDFVSKHFKLNFSRPLSDQDRVKIKKALRGVKVKLSHSGKIRSCKVTGVSREPLRDLTFMLEDNVTRKKVIDYFYEKYNIVLKHPVLPALQAGSDSRPMFFPMEVILFLCLRIDFVGTGPQRTMRVKKIETDSKRTPAPSHLEDETDAYDDENISDESNNSQSDISSVKRKAAKKSPNKVVVVHLDKWRFVTQRRVVVERELGKDVVEVKEIMELIKAAGLMKTVTALP
ncbi:protein argonaute 5 [Lathyrus oleraceus]|uniref:protein argonaute 5 n=1 Tax=Pisum sativum TaxID=3888 RepID=UPI0021D2F8F6|nr:protein argonaute 5-like [Pisum sativum]